MHEVPVNLVGATVTTPSIDDGSAGWTTPGRAPVIPEAAVEAAREASVAWSIHDLPDDDEIRALLEAAAPHIRAQAMRDAAKTFGECEPEGSYSSTPTQVIEWLRDYAELQ